MAMAATDQILILGDGQMALVLADALAVRGISARIWSPFPGDAASLGATRQSPRLAGFRLAAEVDVTGDDGAAFRGVSVVISAIPSQFVRQVWTRLKAHAN